MRILVAEDAIISSIMLEASLVKFGYSVEVAENGKEALEILLSDDPPELALLDWRMPEIDGLEICRKVRSAQKDIYTYIIMLTPSSKVKDVNDCINIGADDYIIKPYFAAELDVRIKAGIRIIRMQEELRNAKSKLQRKMKHDFIDTALLRVANY